MEYDKSLNSIGNTEFQRSITKYIYKKCSALNYTSYIHDILFSILFNIMRLFKEIIDKELNFINRQCLKVLFNIISFTIKILFDLVFLLLGILRSIFKGQPHSLFFVLLFYLVLLISTIYKPLWYKED